MVKTMDNEDKAETCVVRQIDIAKVEQGRALLLSDEVYASTAEMFRALGDSSRAKIVFSLLQQELCVCDLAAVCDLRSPRPRSTYASCAVCESSR